MAPSEQPPEDLMRTLIDTVRDNTEKVDAARQETIATRNSMTATSLSLFSRIVEIERQLYQEAKERPRRQKQLDGAIKHITDRLDGQDETLAGQDQKLDTLFDQQRTVITAGRWRMWLMVGILIVCSFVALRVALVWFGG